MIIEHDADASNAEPDQARLKILERREYILKNRQKDQIRTSMREVILLIDFSAQMGQEFLDYLPCPTYHISSKLKPFIIKFFEQNPLSRLSILLLQNQKTVILSKLDSNPVTHLEAISQLKTKKGAQGKLQIYGTKGNAGPVAPDKYHPSGMYLFFVKELRCYLLEKWPRGMHSWTGPKPSLLL